MVKKVVLLCVLLVLFMGMSAIAQPSAHWPMDNRDVPAADMTPEVIGNSDALLLPSDGVPTAAPGEPIIAPPPCPVGGTNALWLNNAFGTATHAAGTMEYAIATDAGGGNILVGTGDATWSMWFNPNNSHQVGENIFFENLAAPASGVGYTLYQHPPTYGNDPSQGAHPLANEMEIWINGNPANYGAHPWNDGQWYHLAWTRKDDGAGNDTWNLWINGAKFGPDHVLPTGNLNIDGSNQVWLGTRNPGTWPGQESGLGGGIDEAMIFQRALSPNEIMQLVPEPATLCLLGLGGLALIKRRK